MVLVGIYNFFQESDLSAYSLNLAEDSLKLLGNALTAEAASVNTCLRHLANQSENIIYVDTTGTEVGTVKYDETGNIIEVSGDMVHPSVDGHNFITRRILSALPVPYNSDSRYDIHVDLFGSCGENDAITAVLVNNIPCKNYDRDGYSLTVHYSNALAASVTVFTKGEKLGVNKWQCMWNKTDGYHTYSLYRVSDVKRTALLPLINLKTTVNSVSSKIKSLFK